MIGLTVLYSTNAATAEGLVVRSVVATVVEETTDRLVLRVDGAGLVVDPPYSPNEEPGSWRFVKAEDAKAFDLKAYGQARAKREKIRARVAAEEKAKAEAEHAEMWKRRGEHLGRNAALRKRVEAAKAATMGERGAKHRERVETGRAMVALGRAFKAAAARGKP